MCFTNHPRPVPPETYAAAVDRVVARLRRLDGLVAVYQLGGVTAPGISDLDVLAVFEDGVRCAADPLEGLPADDRYLFTHGLFGVSRQFFRAARRYTCYHGFDLRWGTPEPAPARATDAVAALQHQIAREYLVANFISTTIARTYGIVSVRNLLLSVHGLRYDLAFLGVEGGPLYELVHQLIGWRGRWFTQPVAPAPFAAWVEAYFEAFPAFVAGWLDDGRLYLPPWARRRYGRNVFLEPAAALGAAHRGLVLPRRGGVLGKRYVRAQHRFNTFRIALPSTTTPPHPAVAERFRFLKDMKAYNAAHLPAFEPLTGSGNLGVNVV